MSLNFTQNWDGVTAPSVPAGWNADAAMVTTAAKFVSSPNGLFLNDSSNSKKYCTYATSSGDDFAIGDLSTAVQVALGGVDTFAYKGGISYRASSATISDASGVYYWAYINFGGGSPSLRLASVNNGTVTDIVTVSTVASIDNVWLTINVRCSSTTHQVSLVRQSDGQYMNSSGNFGTTPTYAINTTNATISTGNYCGLVASGQTNNNRVYFDDFSAVSQAPNQVIPHSIYVPIPRKFFTEDWG